MKLIRLSIFISILTTLSAQRQISPEARVFSSTKRSVCTVFGKSGHGSGFLYDKRGLIITNDHVLGDNPGRFLSVQFNENEKYYAQVINRDKYKDIAIIAVNPSLVKGIEPLNLATKSDTMVFEGERVIAIGSPLNQTKILTSGIISKVEPKVLMHDVNINPGNSGGPLINMNSDVVGINTFGDISNRGPGIYGSVLITEAEELIKLSKNADVENISTEILPTLPKYSFPISALKKSISKKYPTSIYSLRGNKFEIFIYTPPQMYASKKVKESRMASKRDNRTGEPNRYDLFTDLQDWGSSTGKFKPVVTLVINPKIGQTAGSLVGNVLLAGVAGAAGTGYYSRETYEFKADVKDVSITHGNNDVMPFTSNFQYTTLDFSRVGYYGSSQGEDMAQQAIIELPIDVFRPNETGTFDPLIVTVTNYKDNLQETIAIPLNTIYKINSDFEEYTGDKIGTQLYKAPPEGCS